MGFLVGVDGAFSWVRRGVQKQKIIPEIPGNQTLGESWENPGMIPGRSRENRLGDLLFILSFNPALICAEIRVFSTQSKNEGRYVRHLPENAKENPMNNFPSHGLTLADDTPDPNSLSQNHRLPQGWHCGSGNYLSFQVLQTLSSKQRS